MNSRVIWLICGAYMVDLIFDLAPRGDLRYSFFPFFHGYDGWDGKMTLQNYVYGYCQHVFLILIFHAVSVHTGRKFWCWLMWLEVVDLVCYATFYNHTLFTIFGHSFEFNYIKFMLVLFFTHLEYGTDNT